MIPAGRKTRITLGILIPTLSVPMLFLLLFISTPSTGTSEFNIAGALFFITLVSLTATALPAIAYSLLMEYTLNPKINNSLIVVLVSTSAGFLTGAQMYDYGWHKVGAAVGFASGVLLRAHFHYHQKQIRKG
jgi:hypothetical protein